MNRAWRGSITVRSAVLAAFITSVTCLVMLLGASNATAAFNVTDFDMSPVTPASTSSALQAGGHPTVNFRINPDATLADSSNGDDLKKVTYEFPAGSLGDPKSITTKCSATQFNQDKCPAASYIGSLSVKLRIKPLFSYTTLTAPGSMYVLDPPTPGSALTVGFIVRPPGYRILFLKTEVTGVVSVRNGLDGDYGLTIVVDNIPRILQTTFGVNLNATIQDISIVLNNKSNTSKAGPYFTYAPTRCDVAKVRATMLSYAGVSIVKNDTFTLNGCNNVPFTPSASVTPSTYAANAPANWTANFSVPTAVANIQQSHIKKVEVDLPPATQLNYAELANLTVTCAESQINTDTCPDASKIGTVNAQVPLLDGASPNFVGDVYLLSKTAGVTFGYVVRGPNGITAQIRGYVLPVDGPDADTVPDFIRATSDNMPQAPFSPANITFNKPLVLNPPNCGNQPIKTTITGWSGKVWTETKQINITPCGPATPDTTITSGPTGPTNDNTPTWAFTANPAAGATFEASIDSGAYAAVTSPYTAATLGTGSHTFRVRACAVGATPVCDTTPAERTITVDTVAPNLTINSPTAGALVNSTAVGVSFIASDVTSAVTTTCKLDSAAAATCTSPQNYTGLSQGAHTVEVTVTDAAGNATVRTVSFTVDSIAPTITVNCAANDPAPSSANCVFSSTETLSNVTCQITGGSQESCSSPKIYSALPNGNYTVTVRGNDAASNAGTGVSPQFTINIDTTAPITTLAASGPNGLTNSTSAAFTFSANETATFRCSLDSAPATVCTSPATYSALADGAHTFSVYAVDTSGNADATPETRSWTVDATAPAAPTLSSNRSGTTNQTTATLTAGNLEGGAQLQYSSNGGSTWTNATSPIALSALTDGAKSYTVRQVDAANNASPASSAVTWTVDTVAPAAPTLTSNRSGTTNQTTATLTAANLEGGAQLQVSSDAGATWTNATSPISLSGLTDGAKNYRVRQVDAATNTSASSNVVTWTVDTIAPAAPTVTRTNPTADPTASTTQAISIGNVEGGGTLTCSLDSAAYTPCTTSISLSGLTSGSHTFSVTVTDAATNVSAPGSVTWTVDSSGVAAPTISSGPAAGSFTQSTTATLAFSSTTSGVTYECRVDGAVANYAACTSPYTTATLSDGSHTFYVRAKNGVGTTSAETSRQWTVDTTAPAAPGLSSNRSGSTNQTTATLTATGVEGGAQLQISSNGGSTWTNATSPVSLTGLSGAQSWTARQTDAAGNTSAASAAATWTVDTTPPGAPAVARTNPTADPTASTTQQISITPAEAGGTLTCTLDGSPVACSAGTITLSSLTSATHTFSVFQTDAAGNAGSASSVTWTVNATPVNAPTISSGPAAGSTSGSATATFAFSSTTSGVTYECRVDGTISNYAACTSPFTTATLADGSHTFYVRAINGVGTASPETSRQWTVDTTAPSAPTLSSNRSGVTNQTTATLTAGGLEVGAQLQISSNGGSTWTNATSPVSLTGLTDGAKSYTARQVDGAGNASASSAAVTWTVDTVAPGVPTVTRTVPTADPTSSTSQTITITPAEAGGTLTCTLNGSPYSPCTSPINLTGLTSGVQTFSVTQTDVAGNTGSASTVTWTVNAGGVAAPTISSGPAAGSFTNVNTASFAFSSTTSGVTYECHLDAAAYAACTSPFATGALADGSHTFYVRARNNVGTLSSETTRQWTIDTAAPANPVVTLTSPTTSPTQSTNASISFTGEANATFQGRLDAAAYGVVTSPVALSGLSNGNHTYSVYQVDQAGNQSGVATVSWTVDTVAPAAPTLSSNRTGTTNQTTATLTAGSVEGGAQLQISSNGGSTWTNATSPVSLSGLADGSYSYTARQIDAAGNISAASTAATWTVDTTPPPVPTITSNPTNPTALQTASFAFSSAGASTFECQLDSAAFASCVSGVSYSGLANGSHTFNVRASDAVGNTSASATYTWVVDTSQFTASILTGPTGTVAATSASFTFTATITSGTTYECNNVSGSTAGTTFTACTSGVTYSSLANGTYTFAVRAKNGAQTSPAATRTYTLDTAAPTITPTNPGTTGPSGSIAFTATDPTSPVTVTCQLDSGSFAACTSPYTFSGLTSGSHTLNIRATDGVGNVATVPVTWTVDATPPDTTISGTPTNPTNQTTASLTLSSTESPATFQCNVDGAGYTACTSPLALSGLTNGTHTVLARASDQYGNQDATPASVTWTVDTVAPAAPTLSSNRTGSTNQTTATLTAGNLEGGAQLQISSNGGSTWTNATSPVSLTGLTNGAQSYTARQVDAAGNASAASAAATWTVDTVAPAAPGLTGNRSGTTNQNTATLTATGVEGGATLQISSNGGTTWTNATSPINLSSLADGNYSYTARQIDAAGNTSATSSPAVTWTVDTVAPAAPGLTGNRSGSTNQNTATLTATGVEGGAQLQISSNGGTTWTNATSPVSLTGLADGNYSYTARQIDAAGNTSATSSPAVTWTVDTVAPAAPTLSSNRSGQTNQTTATLTAGNLEVGAQLQVSSNGGSTWTNVTSPHALSGLSGAQSWTARQVDAAGNISAVSAAATWTVDTVAPAAPGLTSNRTGSTNQTTATLTATGVEGGAQLQISSNGGTTWTNATSPVSLTGLADGNYSYTARQIDAAGNTSAVSSAAAWTVDTVAPAAPGFTGNRSGSTNQTTATLTATGLEGGATLQISTNGGSTWTNATSPISLSGLANGNYSYTARQVDAAGNNSAASAAVTWTVDTIAPGAPTVTRTNPTENPTSSTSQTITITPAEAGGTLACTLNGSPYTPCTSPVQLNGLASQVHTFSVTQTDAAGNTGSAQAVTWTVNSTPVAAPTISSGPAEGSSVSSLTASFAFSSTTSGVTYECKIDAGAFAACTSPFATGTLGQGSHTFTVRAKNNVNVLSPETARTWIIDTVAPAAPTLTRTSPTSTPTNQTTATLTAGNLEAGAQLQVSSNGGSTWTNATSPVSLTGLTAGSYSYTARQIDAAGNISPVSSPAVTWTVDLTAPAAPTLTRTAPATSPTNSTSATLTAGGVEGGAQLQISSNGGSTWTNATSPVALSGLADGNYSYTARQIDAAGNIGPASSPAVTWTVDTVVPVTPTLTRTSPTSTPTNQTTAIITAGNLEAGTQLQCSTNGGSTFSNCSSPINLSGLTAGIYGYFARQVDAAGNVSGISNLVSWEVDLTGPAAPTVSTPPNSSATSGSITFSGPSDAVSWQCSLDSAAFAACTSPRAWSVSSTPATHTFAVRALDAAGNIGSVTTVSWQVTSSVPLPNTLIGDAPATSPTLTPSIPVSTDTGTSYQCSVNDGPTNPCTPSSGSFGAALNDVATNKIAIAAVNSAGPDLTPAVTYVWVSTAAVTSSATVTASDTRAGAHPSTVSGTIILNGGYNAKTVSVQMPLGLNGALTATSQKCDASGGNPETMDCAVSAPGSAIGTISGVGVASTVGTITDATSTVYLTTPPADGTSPAGVWVDVKSPSNPQLGHIRAFGWVNIQQIDNGVINGETRQAIVIPSLPERTSTGVRFHVNSVNLVLQGDPPGGTYPLITNPTTCDPHNFVGGGTTWAADGLGGDGPEIPAITVDYPVTDCETLEFNPQLDQEFFMVNPRDGSTYDPDDPASSVESVGKDLDSNLAEWRMGAAGTVATVSNGGFSTTARRAAMKELTVLQPQGTGATFAALAGPGTTCPGSAASLTGLFDQGQCSPAAQVGTASIDTPLLEEPLVGTVWLINNTPLPWVGIRIAPDTGPNNPAGVFISLTATTDLTCASDAPSCVDATYKRVTIVASNLPDVPMDSVTLDLSGRTARAHDNNDNPTPGLILAMPDAGNAGCRTNDNVFSSIVAGTGSIVDAQMPTTMAHCPQGAPLPTIARTAPTTSPSNSTSATFNLTNPGAGAGATLRCKLDQGAWYACAAGVNTLTGLTNGSHSFNVRAVNAAGDDASPIAINNWVVDTVPPTLTLTKNAANSGSVTFAWTRNENGSVTNGFLCSKDGSAYTTGNCNPIPPTTGRNGTQTWTGVVAGSGSHTFGVRITDPAGNQTTQTVTWTA